MAKQSVYLNFACGFDTKQAVGETRWDSSGRHQGDRAIGVSEAEKVEVEGDGGALQRRIGPYISPTEQLMIKKQAHC